MSYLDYPPIDVPTILEFMFPAYLNMLPYPYTFTYDGEGNITGIDVWNIPNEPKPDLETILGWATSATFLRNRANYYADSSDDGNGSPSDQINTIFDDILNSTNNWLTNRANVKYEVYPEDNIPSTPPTIARLALLSDIPDLSSYALKSQVPDESSAGKHCVIATNSSSQTITATGSPVTLGFDTEVIDGSSCFSSNTYTAPEDGLYRVSCFTQTSNYAILSLLNAYTWSLAITQSGSVNQSVEMDLYTHGLLAATDSALKGSLLIKLLSGDTIKIQVQKGNINSLTCSNSYLSINKESGL